MVGAKVKWWVLQKEQKRLWGIAYFQKRRKNTGRHLEEARAHMMTTFYVDDTIQKRLETAGFVTGNYVTRQHQMVECRRIPVVRKREKHCRGSTGGS